MTPLPSENITLKVDPEAAKIFKTASSEERKKLEILISSLLKQYGKSNPETSKEIKEPELDYEDRVLIFKAEPVKDVNLETVIDDLRKEELTKLLASIDSHLWTPPSDAPSTLELLRQDRDQ